MQRSRRALLRRRAAALESSSGLASAAGRRKRRLYQVSVSLVVASWVVILLLNSLVGHGNGHHDGQDGSAAVTEPSSLEKSFNPAAPMGIEENLTVSDRTCDRCDEIVQVSEGTPLLGDELASECAVESNDAEVATKESKTDLSEAEGERLPQTDVDPGVKTEIEDTPRTTRLSRVVPPRLDEFKTKAIAEKEKGVSSRTGNVIHRVEPSGKEYNYASASKGAKVLAFNKEAKGASNILERDKDKYLRNPCSAEGKFVVIELSEETLVDTIEIANFEHYSSNLKDFEVLSSLVYPTENWEKLGNVTAANAKHAQRFSLTEPKWARYLKLNLLSHYGSEFYCTLSMFEVYGVDAVEMMLEDLIPVENRRMEPDDQDVEQIPLKENTDGKDSLQELFDEDDFNIEDDKTKDDALKRSVPDPIAETRTLQAGRVPGDTVLKVLMQKVQSLDVSFSVLERYLEELNSRYGQIFEDFDSEMDSKDLLLEKIKSELKHLQSSKDNFVNEIEGILSWKLVASSQLDHLIQDNAILRSEVQKIREQQVELENRGLAVILLSFIFGCLAVSKLFIGMILNICRLHLHGSEKSQRTSSGWLVLLLSSCIIASILVLY